MEQTKEKQILKNGVLPTVKSAGLILYFIIAQVFISFIVIGIKIATDTDWVYAVNNCLNENGMLSSEYFALIMELLVPVTMLADIVIALPIVIKAFVKKEKLYKSINIKEILGYAILGVVLNIVISFIVNLLPQNITSDYNAMMDQVMIGNFFITLLATGIVAPVVEELLFRYCICDWYHNEKLGIFMSAFIFGLAHMNLIQSTYAFLLGLILAYLYKKKNNLTVPTIIHIAINCSSVLFTYFIG